MSSASDGELDKRDELQALFLLSDAIRLLLEYRVQKLRFTVCIVLSEIKRCLEKRRGSPFTWFYLSPPFKTQLLSNVCIPLCGRVAEHLCCE